MIRALIVDDEHRARNRMRRLLGDHADVDVVGEAATGDEAVQQVLALRPDVVFLDIRMPGKDGVEAARAFGEYLPAGLRPLVIFTTAYDDRAVDAFAVKATDYLMKPVERERLAEALRRVREARYAVAAPAVAPPPPTAPTPSPTAGHLAGHKGSRVVNLSLADVAVIEVEDTITFARTPDGRFRLKSTLQALEHRLSDPPFVRVSRSQIVQLDWIDTLRPGDSGTYAAVLKAPLDLEVQVSRRRARRLRELLGW